MIPVGNYVAKQRTSEVRKTVPSTTTEAASHHQYCGARRRGRSLSYLCSERIIKQYLSKCYLLLIKFNITFIS